MPTIVPNPRATGSARRVAAHHARAGARRRMTQANARRAIVAPATPKGRGGKIPSALAAGRAKRVASIVAGGAVAVRALTSNSGRATDKTIGRPTGIFGY